MTYVHQRAILTVSLLVLMLAVRAHAQLQLGDNTSMNLSGNMAFGYTGDYSSFAGSAHTLTPSGNADLSGFYYSPGFLSFDVQPFYNESRANSTYQSIFESGGVTGTASLFSGSHFPGTVSYSKIHNNEGGLSIPGVGNLTTRGNSDNLVLGWGIQIPDYPRVSFSFADGGSDSTVFGTTSDASFHSRTFGVNASDKVEGFQINGGYHHNNVNSTTPEFLAGEGPLTSQASSNSFDVSATHLLPFHGAFSAGAGRSDITSDASGEQFNATIDTLNSGVGFQPITNLNLGVNAQYTDNLEGSLYQSVITSGGIVPSSLLNYSTHSLDINSQATYVIPDRHLTILGSFDRREQSTIGTPISADSFDEMVTYGNEFKRGFLTLTGGATQTSVIGFSSVDSRGFFGNASYTRKIDRWSFSGSGNYSRNNQTAYIGYTSSGYGYSVGVGRKIHTSSYWSFNASQTRSTFNNTSGGNNFNQSYSTALSLRHFSVSGSYGKADGTSILTATGLTPISSPTPDLSPFQEIVFNGKSYAFGMSTTPIHGLILSGSYSIAKSDTEAISVFSKNSTAQLNTMLQYKVRKLWLTAGYLKLQQGFSITGQPPTSDSSFFVGITRWFNFF